MKRIAKKYLSRLTSGGSFIPEVDAIRFIAIMWVILFHIYGSTPGREITEVNKWYLKWFTDFCASGHFGVPLFFTLSGFILSLPFAKFHLIQGKKIDLTQYFVRRITRLEPPYIIHLFLLSVLFYLTWEINLIWPLELTSKIDPIPFMSRHNLASLFYVHQASTGYANPLNVVLWSLEVEVQFYILMPLLSLIFLIRKTYFRRILLVVGIIGCQLISNYVIRDTLISRIGLSVYLHWFLVGFLLADLYLKSWTQVSNKAALWDIIGIFCWIMLLTQIHKLDSTYAVYLMPFIVMICCISVFRGNRIKLFFRNFWITLIGAQCYTIYMYHYIIVQWLGKRIQAYFGNSNDILSLCVLILTITTTVIFVSSIMFALFERPFMRRDWQLTLITRIRTAFSINN